MENGSCSGHIGAVCAFLSEVQRIFRQEPSEARTKTQSTLNAEKFTENTEVLVIDLFPR